MFLFHMTCQNPLSREGFSTDFTMFEILLGMFRTFMNRQRLFREETFITIFALKCSVAMNFHMMPQSRTVSKISSAKVTHMVLRKVLKVVDCMSPVKSKVESNYLTPTYAALIAYLPDIKFWNKIFAN